MYPEKVLQEKKLGYVVFDQNLTVIDSQLKFTRYFEGASPVKFESTLWDLFPELVGAEDVVQDILASKKNHYNLSQLNRVDKQGRLQYYGVSFFGVTAPDAGGRQLFCLIENETDATALEQEVRQSKYEIQLLKRRAGSEAHFLSESILGEAEKVHDVREFIAKIAKHGTTVLLQGESGTGKSLVARVIHRASENPSGPFVEINCAAIPDTLLESELFGYEKGAFTNALVSKAGLLEQANGGTLFLDEIGEMPLALQAKLLTFMENRSFRRLGSTQETAVQVRLVAATNCDLRQAVSENRFRQDLFFRINVVSLTLPPLRELGDDVIILAEHFIELLRFDIKKTITGLSPSARRKLVGYRWPGNVRELRNVIERAMIFCAGERIEAEDLVLMENPEFTGGNDDAAFVQIPDEGLSIVEVEKQLLVNALEKTRGNQSRSASLLGLSLDTFRYRLKKYDISPKDYH